MKRSHQRLVSTCLLILSFITLCGMDACKMRHTLTGQVTGEIQEGIKMILSDSLSDNTTTGTDGIYVFANLDNGSYTITPNKQGYTFSPLNQNITIPGDDISNVDFFSIILDEAYLISGTVNGEVLEGVTITLTGASNTAVTTDEAGDFSIEDLDNGTYTVTPSLAGYDFSPRSQSVVIAGTDDTGIDFTATQIPNTYLISGTLSGDLITGVTIALTGDSTATMVTSSSGNYSFAGLLNGSYTITPSKNGYTFAPTNENITVTEGDETGVDFTVTKNVTGEERFTDNGDGTIRDERTGLIWLKNADCFGRNSWHEAKTSVAGLNSGECGLSDSSVEGDWRLPAKEELQRVGTDPPTIWLMFGPLVPWTMPGEPFVNMPLFCWSSTTTTVIPGVTWITYMIDGSSVLMFWLNSGVGIWPVRTDN